MSVTGVRSVLITFSGDLVSSNSYAAATNSTSPGQRDIVTLTNGANTITPPTGGTIPQAVTIIPPAANTNSMTLKGVSGDTGVSLHLTDPTSIGLGSTTGTFVITTAAVITGVQFIWT